MLKESSEIHEQEVSPESLTEKELVDLANELSMEYGALEVDIEDLEMQLQAGSPKSEEIKNEIAKKKEEQKLILEKQKKYTDELAKRNPVENEK